MLIALMGDLSYRSDVQAASTAQRKVEFVTPRARKNQRMIWSFELH